MHRWIGILHFFKTLIKIAHPYVDEKARGGSRPFQFAVSCPWRILSMVYYLNGVCSVDRTKQSMSTEEKSLMQVALQQLI